MFPLSTDNLHQIVWQPAVSSVPRVPRAGVRDTKVEFAEWWIVVDSGEMVDRAQ